MRRVISLLPSATEIVCALGAHDALVGVTHECDFPDVALHKPRVTTARINPSMQSAGIDRLVRAQLDDSGSLYALDMDLVRDLAPDLVLTQQLCTVCAVGYSTVQLAMKSLPSPPQVVNLEPRTLAEVFRSFVDVAKMLECGERGIQLVDHSNEQLRAMPRPVITPRVLLLEWLQPPFAPGHWIPELVEAAGAIPVLGYPGEHSRQVEWPAIERAPFDVMAISCCGFSVERSMKDVDECDELRAVDARAGNFSIAKPYCIV